MCAWTVGKALDLIEREKRLIANWQEELYAYTPHKYDYNTRMICEEVLFCNLKALLCLVCMCVSCSIRF